MKPEDSAWKHAVGVTGLQQRKRLRIAHRNQVEIDLFPRTLENQVQSVTYDSQGREAQKVEFHQAGFFRAFHVERGRDGVIRLAEQRDHLVDRPVADDHAGGVRGRMAYHPLDAPGHIEQLPLPMILFDLLRETRLHLDCLVQRHIEGSRNQLGQNVHFTVRHIEDATDVPNGSAGLHASKSADLRHALFPVLPLHVFDDFFAPVLAEVAVDVGERYPVRVEEPLEEQAVRDRVQLRDPKGVRHQGTGGRAAARSHGDAVAARECDEIPNDQEVAREPHLFDHGELVRKALPVFLFLGFRKPFAPAPLLLEPGGQPLFRFFPEVSFGGLSFRHRELRDPIFAQRELYVAAFRDLEGVPNRFGSVGEGRDHLLRRLHEKFFGPVAQPIREDRVFCVWRHITASCSLASPPLQLVAIVGGHERSIGAPRQLDQQTVDLYCSGSPLLCSSR